MQHSASGALTLGRGDIPYGDMLPKFTDVSLETLRRQQQLFAEERQWQQFHTPRNLLLALVGEVGELSEIFQWKGEVERGLTTFSEEERVHVGEELSDVLLYLIRLADMCDVDLGRAVMDKLQKNKYKYPADKCRGSAAKYTQLGKGSGAGPGVGNGVGVGAGGMAPGGSLQDPNIQLLQMLLNHPSSAAGGGAAGGGGAGGAGGMPGAPGHGPPGSSIGGNGPGDGGRGGGIGPLPGMTSSNYGTGGSLFSLAHALANTGEAGQRGPVGLPSLPLGVPPGQPGGGAPGPMHNLGPAGDILGGVRGGMVGPMPPRGMPPPLSGLLMGSPSQASHLIVAHDKRKRFNQQQVQALTQLAESCRWSLMALSEEDKNEICRQLNITVPRLQNFFNNRKPKGLKRSRSARHPDKGGDTSPHGGASSDNDKDDEGEGEGGRGRSRGDDVDQDTGGLGGRRGITDMAEGGGEHNGSEGGSADDNDGGDTSSSKRQRRVSAGASAGGRLGSPAGGVGRSPAGAAGGAAGAGGTGAGSLAAGVTVDMQLLRQIMGPASAAAAVAQRQQQEGPGAGARSVEAAGSEDGTGRSTVAAVAAAVAGASGNQARKHSSTSSDLLQQLLSSDALRSATGSAAAGLGGVGAGGSGLAALQRVGRSNSGTATGEQVVNSLVSKLGAGMRNQAPGLAGNILSSLMGIGNNDMSLSLAPLAGESASVVQAAKKMLQQQQRSGSNLLAQLQQQGSAPAGGGGDKGDTPSAGAASGSREGPPAPTGPNTNWLANLLGTSMADVGARGGAAGEVSGAGAQEGAAAAAGGGSGSASALAALAAAAAAEPAGGGAVNGGGGDAADAAGAPQS